MQVVVRVEHSTDAHTNRGTDGDTDGDTDRQTDRQTHNKHTDVCCVDTGSNIVMYLKRLLQPGNNSQASLGRSHAGLVGTHCQHKA